MDYLNDLHDMCDILSRELGEANEKIRSTGGKLSGSDLDYVDKLTHAIKSIKTTLAMMGEGESGTYPYYGNAYDDTNRMSGRGSYARRRDSRGRYSNGYSRDESMIAELRDLMQDAPDDRTRQEFQRFIDKIERM